jgi:DNA-binding LacI/PurR family transcriptional regulator
VNAFARDVVESYRRWAARTGRPDLLEVVSVEAIVAGPEPAYDEAVQRLMERGRPDALFVPVELAGVRALHALRGLGRRVPHDVLLATTHDIGRGSETDPQLTSLEWNYQEMGRRAAALLFDLIDGTASAPCEIVVPTTLVPRASTAR